MAYNTQQWFVLSVKDQMQKLGTEKVGMDLMDINNTCS